LFEDLMTKHICDHKSFMDDRGSLSFGEIGNPLPFTPSRFFIVYDVPTGIMRGGHAHKICEQYLISVSGEVEVLLNDGGKITKHLLTSPAQGLHIPAGIWGEQRYLTSSSRLLVLTSHVYDEDDYIRSYDDFCEFRKAVK
jgi:UDP-2-acetamido-3-amino-2,3-dideoxy-glucuronate N-acetyltransferase